MATLGLRRVYGRCSAYIGVCATQSGWLDHVRLSTLQHFPCARAFQAIAQRAVWVDFFVADEALVRITNGVQTSAASLDAFVHEDDAKRHTKDDQKKQTEG